MQSTLDSAIRYELLKPVVISLQKENFFLVKQVGELRMANDLLLMDLNRLQTIINEEKRKTRRAWAGAGFGGLLALLALLK